MGDDRRHERHRRRRRRRRDGDEDRERRGRKRRDGARREREGEGEGEELLLSPEERTWLDAQRLVERKVKLTRDAVKVGVAVFGFAIFGLWIVSLIILVVGGARILKDFYGLVLEPKLRERFVQQEVDKQVHASISRERQALEGEHARSLEHLSASIAHEIRNPITAAKSLVQQMGEEPRANENVEYARVALEELERVERSVSHLLRFARDEELQIRAVRLADVVDSALETFRDRVARSRIEVDRSVDTEGQVVGDAEKLRRVVINLVGNAIDALEESKTDAPRIEVHMGENLAGSEVWLRIVDNGPGIDGEVLQKMFNPFYTSKSNGTGLGLPICKKLVDAHGGNIEVNSEAGAGAEFVLTFPKQLEAEGDQA